MDKIFFVKPVLGYITDGGNFKKVYAIVLKIVAVIAGLAGLGLWIAGWGEVSRASTPDAVVGRVIMELLMIVAFYMIIHILWFRADFIAALPGSDHDFISIMSVSLKMAGEVYAVLGAFFSLGTGIGMIFGGGYYFRQVLPFNPFFSNFPLGYGGIGILGGLSTICIGVFSAFATLLLFYFLSEMIAVFVDIARNTKR